MKRRAVIGETCARVQEANGSPTGENSGEPDSVCFSELELAEMVIVWMWRGKGDVKDKVFSLE